MFIRNVMSYRIATKTLWNINCTTAKTNALKLFEKQLKLGDFSIFFATFLFDSGSALDIIN